MSIEVMNNLQFQLTGLRLYSIFFPVLLFFFSKMTQTAEGPTATSAPSALTVDIQSNGPLCAGTTLTLSASPGGGTAPYSFSWNGPAGFNASTDNPIRPNTITAHAGNYGVTATDANGMTGTATIAVEIFPTAMANAGPDKHVCKGTTATLNGSFGGAATSAFWTASVVGGNFSPNASALNAVYTPPPGFEGNIVFTLTTNDPAGPCPAASDQALVNFFDTEGLVCNDLVELSLDDDCSVAVTPDMLLEGDIPEELFSVTIYTQTGINIGNTITGQYLNQTLKAKVTDLCNWNICYTDIKVVDRVEPNMFCTDLMLNCAISNFTPENLKNNIGVPGAYPTVVENCSPFILTYLDVWTDVPCNGSINGMNDVSAYVRRTWTATDASGNKETCLQYLYFKRISLADVQFPADAQVSCRNPNTNPSITGTPFVMQYGKKFPLHPSANYCEISVTYTDQIAPSCAGSYSIIRTWRVFDFCNPTAPLPPNQNPLVVNQVVNVQDNMGPHIQCPGNVTVNTSLLNCCANMPLPSVIVGDSCSKVLSIFANVYTIHPVTGDTLAQYDIKGNLSNFPGNNLGYSDTLATFGTTPCLPLGVHRVVYTALDACGQSSICAFNATVADQIPPVAACDEITQVSLGIDGMILVNAATFDDGSYDNCGPVYFKVRRELEDKDSCQRYDRFHDQAKFCCSDIGDTVSVILRIYDIPVPLGEIMLDYEVQHSNECQVQVYVDDKLRPVCVAPPHLTVDCENFDPSLWAYGMATAADNCCMDTITSNINYALFDTTCNRGTLTRTFRAFDCMGLNSTCTQRIVVNYRQHYFVKFPDDKMITACDGSGIYGKPEFFGEDCELLATSFKDDTFTVVPDACFKIERHWTIINWCSYDPNKNCLYVPNPNPNTNLNHATNLPGPIVSEPGTTGLWASTIVKINPTDANATDFSKYWAADPNCYRYTQVIKIQDNQKPVIDCPTKPDTICDQSDNHPMFWNNNAWYDPLIQTHDLCEAPSDLCITATDACSGANIGIRYLLFLDVDNNGSMETVINSINAPEAGKINYNNAGNPNYVGGTLLEFDNRVVSPNAKRQFSIRTAVNGPNKTACVSWNTPSTPNSHMTPELPYGKHKIKWIVEDGCGNNQVCEYQINVKDCKPPTIYCRNGLSVNMMPTGMVVLFASYFIEGALDNCTPKEQLIYAIRKSGTGTGFPVDAQGNPITQLTFDCTELGLQLVEVWVKDKAGNADFCRTYLLVQDNSDACGPKASISGALKTEMGSGLQEANIEIKGQLLNGLNPMSLFDITDVHGKYMFSNALPIASNFNLTPLRDDNPLNGVTTLDIALITKHILGLQPLGSPYKIIAADVNNSKSITTFDVVELRKLILGINENFGNNTSWRFVDKAYTFPNPNNPFLSAFPESKTLANIQGNQMEEDFVSIKIGDVNTSAIANNLMLADDRTNGILYFDVSDANIKEGETKEVVFTASEQVQGYQFTLLHPDLELLDLVPGENMSMDNFGVFKKEHVLTTSFDGSSTGTFKVRFRATRSGQLSQMLSISGKVTVAEAYTLPQKNAQSEKLELALRFNNEQGTGSTIVGMGFEVYQNQPNPFVQKTLIGFHLPAPERSAPGDLTKVSLTLYDESGKVLYREEGDFPKGYNHFTLERPEIPDLTSLGVLYYKVETNSASATKKMVHMKE